MTSDYGRRGKLERGLGLIEATSLNVTFMVGIGPFVVIPLMVQAMGGPQCLIAWVIGAGLALMDGCVWAELGAAMPQAGGSYVFLREAYGPGRWGRLLSFLYIWQTLFQGPLSVASGALGFAGYSSYLTAKSAGASRLLQPFGAHADSAVAALAVVVAVALLYRRITVIGKISVALCVIVVGTILWLIFGGWGTATSIPAWCSRFRRARGIFRGFFWRGWGTRRCRRFTAIWAITMCAIWAGR